MKLLWVALLPLAGAASIPSARAETGGAPIFASHRAVYDLSLIRSEGNKAPSTARGRIAFDFTGSTCEGYSQNFRQMTELQGSDGPQRISDMRSATFEDGDGKTFRFKVETDVDQKPVEMSDGSAARSHDGGLSVSLLHPKITKLDVVKDVVFPTDHLRRIIEAARGGEHLLAVKVYDGSETGTKIFDTTTVIGKAMTGEVDDAAKDVPDLATTKRWPVTISYFEEGKVDSQPNYTLSFDLYDNGISRELKLDYGDFALLGHMVKLELLPSKPCKS